MRAFPPTALQSVVLPTSPLDPAATAVAEARPPQQLATLGVAVEPPAFGRTRAARSVVAAAAAGAAAAGWAGGGRRVERRRAAMRANLASPAVEGPSVDRAAWERGYESALQEECYAVECEDLPADLVGTYFRNGPAKFNIGDDQILHPFDGDGMVAAITLDGKGNAVFRNRFVRTPGFVEELKADKMLYRGTFSLKPGGWINNAFDVGGSKNLANTNIMYWAGDLLALWEGAKPTSLDPLSLATKGETMMNNALLPGDRFSAHPRYDPVTGRMIGFCNNPNPNATKLTFWEFEPESFRVHSRIEAEVPDFGFYHDFVVTENYYILSKGPMDMELPDLLKSIVGLQSIGESMRFNKTKPGGIVLVPRDGSEKQIFDVDPHFTFHFANAYERDGNVIIDMVRAPELVLGSEMAASGDPVWRNVDFENLPKSHLWRYTVSPSTGDWSRKELVGRYLDFPSVPDVKKGRPYRFTYCLTATCAAGPMAALLKVDVEDLKASQTWNPEPHEFLGEPIYCPREGAKASEAEDDGYVVSILLNGLTKTTEFCVFDASNILTGPICRVPLRTFIPHALHGTWAAGYVPSQLEIEAAWSRAPTDPL